MLQVRALNSDLIKESNNNSFGGTRGSNSEKSYLAYAKQIQEWNISDKKKQSLLDKLYDKYSVILRYEAQHVSVMVAGPARYNAKKLDKGDKILELSAEFCRWFDDLKEQVERSTVVKERSKVSICLDYIKHCDRQGDSWNIRTYLEQLCVLDNKKFIEVFKQMHAKYKFRKNTKVYKKYEQSLKGEIKEVKNETLVKKEDYKGYTEGNRAYIQFTMRPKRQLIVALKSRGWWWNAYAQAWSTYLDRVDWDWVQTIDTQYAKYM